MEIARLFGVLPVQLNRLPLSEFRLMVRYYNSVRAATEKANGGPSPSDKDTVVE